LKQVNKKQWRNLKNKNIIFSEYICQSKL